MPVSGLTALDASWTLGGGANPFSSDVALDTAFNTDVTLPDGQTSITRAKVRMREVDSITPGYYGRSFSFTPVDVTDKLVFLWIALDNISTNLVNEVRLAFGSGTSDWVRFNIFEANYPYEGKSALYHPVVIDISKTPSALGGVISPAAIDRLELSIYHDGASAGIRPWVGEAYIADLQWVGGTPEDPGNLSKFVEFFSSQFVGPVVRQPVSQNGIYFDIDLSRVKIGDGVTPTYFSEQISGVSFSSLSEDTFLQTSQSSRRLTLASSAGGFIRLGSVFSSANGWTLESLAGCDAEIDNATLNNVNAFEVVGPITATQTRIANSAQVIASSLRLLSGRIVNSDDEVSYAYSYTSGDLPPNGLVISSGETAQLNCTPGDDLSQVEVEFEGTAVCLLNPSSSGTSAIDLTGLTAASGSSLQLDNATSNNVLVTLGEGVIYNIVTPTTGGGAVDVQTPPKTLTITGFPSGSQVAVFQAGIQLDLTNDQSPPYIYTKQASESDSYVLRITAAGYDTLTQEITFAEDSIVPVFLQLSNSEDRVPNALATFISRMKLNSAFQRVKTEAAMVPELAGELETIKQGVWPSAAFKTAWNSVIVHASITPPTAGEISTWTQYLVDEGYTAIAFNSVTGEVS